LHCSAIRTAICPSVARARREGSAQGLGSEDDVNAKGPALPDDPVKEERCILGDARSSSVNS